MHANAIGSHKRTGGLDDLEVTADIAGEGGVGIAPGRQDEQRRGRDISITRGRALLIYLKHRGVLNVEEFRRTNARGL